MPKNYSKKNEAKLRFFLEKKANDTESSSTENKNNSTGAQTDKRLPGGGCDQFSKKR